MQTNPEQLKRQQLILKVLGYYSGKLDGIWGPQSIKAKQCFEADPSYVPGNPNNGLPFTNVPPYPKGISINNGLLYHPLIDTYKDKPEVKESKSDKK